MFWIITKSHHRGSVAISNDTSGSVLVEGAQGVAGVVGQRRPREGNPRLSANFRADRGARSPGWLFVPKRCNVMGLL